MESVRISTTQLFRNACMLGEAKEIMLSSEKVISDDFHNIDRMVLTSYNDDQIELVQL